MRCAIVFCLALCAVACSRAPQREVVIYTALDELYSRPILDTFEAKTNIRVVAAYDTEASKTTGLVNRLIAEKNRPRADVFWNNEAVQTIVLKQEGVLEAYASPSAKVFPMAFKDAEHYWTGFAARGRVLIVNTELMKPEDAPRTIMDLLDEKWRGKVAIANPLFGTTATHAAVLFAEWGPERAKAFFLALKANDVAILPGNATVRDLVARGEYAVGLTDTDDANGAAEDGFPVTWHLVEQEADGLGALVIPNSVALVKGAPHREEAKALIDYLLSPEVETALARTRSIQIPLNSAVEVPRNVPDLSRVRVIDADFEKAAEMMSGSAAFIRDQFLE